MQVGFKALAAQYGIALAQPLRVDSIIGTGRASRDTGEQIENRYPPAYRPVDDFAGHFEFGLKYEEIHLEFFARLFAAVGPAPIEAWCRNERFGQYARRTGFFYEWLTGHQLDVPDVDNGRYIEAISSDQYLTRTDATRVRRWRINNNLPGTVDFCPIVRRTPAVQEALQFDLGAALDELDRAYGADVLMRTASWLTFKESRASFLIREGSGPGRPHSTVCPRHRPVLRPHPGPAEQPEPAYLASCHPGARRLGARTAAFPGLCGPSHDARRHRALHRATL